MRSVSALNQNLSHIIKNIGADSFESAPMSFSYLPSRRKGKLQEQPHYKESKCDDAECYKHRLEHQSHRRKIRFERLLKGRLLSVFSRGASAADTRHIGYRSAVVNIFYLLFFLLFAVFAHLITSHSLPSSSAWQAAKCPSSYSLYVGGMCLHISFA